MKWEVIKNIPNKIKTLKSFFDGKIKLRVIFIALGGKTVLTSIKIHSKLITDDCCGLNVGKYKSKINPKSPRRAWLWHLSDGWVGIYTPAACSGTATTEELLVTNL